MDTRDDKYYRAKDRVTQLKKFYGKLVRSFIVVALLAGFNYYLNEWDHPWFLWVAFFVALGLVIEAGKTFGIGWILGRNWEERKIKEMMDKEDQPSSRNSNRWE